MSKINVLVFPSDRTGVSKFRSVEPHMKLQELYNDDFHIEIVTAGTTIDWEDENYLKRFQIVHFHRALPRVLNGQVQQAYLEDAKPLFEKLKRLGIITIMDLDDYWLPGKEHPAYQIIVDNGVPTKIRKNVEMADYITTTTKIYAKEISKLNKNVMVLPNAIDPSEKQFTPKPEESSKKVRFGWLGGSSHQHDLTLMSPNVVRFLREYKDDSQMVICGYDLRGNITERNPATGEARTRKIKPHESVWCRYEEYFTNDYKLLDDEYLKQLKKYDQDSDKKYDDKGEVYRRVWTKPITSYASNYNLFDVSMAPLKETMFNMCKSQLKVIEAGFHKKALIAQDFGPYQIDCVNLFEYGGGINEKGNAILIPTSKNHKQWYKAMKKLHDNPELVDLLSNNLYETVKDKYHIDTVTHSRAEFYKTILKENQKEINELIEDKNAV